VIPISPSLKNARQKSIRKDAGALEVFRGAHEIGPQVFDLAPGPIGSRLHRNAVEIAEQLAPFVDAHFRLAAAFGHPVQSLDQNRIARDQRPDGIELRPHFGVRSLQILFGKREFG
jgi:hypothetical protein